MLLSQMRKMRPRKFKTPAQGHRFSGEPEIQTQVFLLGFHIFPLPWPTLLNQLPVVTSALVPWDTQHKGVSALHSETLGSSRARFLKTIAHWLSTIQHLLREKWEKCISRPDPTPKELSTGA